jgi:hypothetical protein
MREPISDKLRKKVLQRDNNRCRYCGSTKQPFHLDHVYPVSKGGETSFDNLVTSCAKCNLHKHNHTGIWPVPMLVLETLQMDLTSSFCLIIIGLGFLTTPMFKSVLITLPNWFSFGVTIVGLFLVWAGLTILRKHI